MRIPAVFFLKMKPIMLVKLFLAALLGSLFGGLIAFDHSRWLHLGRDAFMAYQTRRFDMNMAQQNSGIGIIIGTAIFAVGLAAIYETVAIGGERLLTRLSNQKEIN
jgi:hypothetical protein